MLCSGDLMWAMYLVTETLRFMASKAKHLQSFEHPRSLLGVVKSVGAQGCLYLIGRAQHLTGLALKPE